MLKSKKNYCLILASGGLDSTGCIKFYKDLKFNVELLFVDYGQPANKFEFDALKKISKHYRINVKRIVLKNSEVFKPGVIAGRNAFLLFTALLNFKKKNGTIACGLHAGTDYFDCSKDFVKIMQELFDKYTQNTVKIGVPFLNFTKMEIYNYCISGKIPIELTYSCELGTKKPCGHCNTCKDLKVIYASQK